MAGRHELKTTQLEYGATRIDNAIQDIIKISYPGQVIDEHSVLKLQ